MAKRYRYHIGLEVGEPYLPGRTDWGEHVEYNGFRINGHWFRMFLNSLTGREIMDVREGEAEFALYVEGDVILLLYRFGASFPWSDAPYSIHLTRLEDREVPGPEPVMAGEDPLLVVLVEARSGILQAARDLWLAPEFSRALRSAIRAQARRPWPGGQSYDRQIQEIYRRYPRPQDMLGRAVARARIAKEQQEIHGVMSGWAHRRPRSRHRIPLVLSLIRESWWQRESHADTGSGEGGNGHERGVDYLRFRHRR